MNEVHQFIRDHRPEEVSEEDWNTYCRVLMHVDDKKLMINPQGYRSYLYEMKYFGADINKFINLHCNRHLAPSKSLFQ